MESWISELPIAKESQPRTKGTPQTQPNSKCCFPMSPFIYTTIQKTFFFFLLFNVQLGLCTAQNLEGKKKSLSFKHKVTRNWKREKTYHKLRGFKNLPGFFMAILLYSYFLWLQPKNIKMSSLYCAWFAGEGCLSINLLFDSPQDFQVLHEGVEYRVYLSSWLSAIGRWPLYY